MNADVVHVAGTVLGAGTAVAAGAVAGGAWWAVGVAGAAACMGSIFDRHLDHVQVLVALALVAGLVGAGQVWFVVVLAVGTLASIEVRAAADRTTVTRPEVADLGRIVPASVGVATLTAVLLVVGVASNDMPALATVGAALAAVFAIRVIAR